MQLRFSAAEQSEVWDRFESGESMRSIARSIGRSQAGVHDLIQKTGGIRPLVHSTSLMGTITDQYDAPEWDSYCASGSCRPGGRLILETINHQPWSR